MRGPLCLCRRGGAERVERILHLCVCDLHERLGRRGILDDERSTAGGGAPIPADEEVGGDTLEHGALALSASHRAALRPIVRRPDR